MVFWLAGLFNLTALAGLGAHLLLVARLAQIGLSLGVLVLAGWFWRQLARADGGLLAPVLGHMAADFTILMAVYQKSVSP